MSSSRTDKVQSPALASRSSAERCLFGLLALVFTGVLLIAIGQTIGIDAMRQVLRWKRLRVTPIQPAHVPTESGATVGFHAGPSAADAQISPPRRRPTSREAPASAAVPPVDADFPKAVNDLIPETTDSPLDAVAGLANVDRLQTQAGAGDPMAALLETAAQLVSLSWQDFAYPVRLTASETSKTRMIYVNHRNRLLKSIAHSHPSALSLELARRDYAMARSQFDQDPRLDYAFGLVLWKHQQFSEATEMFQTAARLEGVPFLPAALAVAWGRFLTGQERRGLDQLSHIARRLAETDGEYPTGSQRQQAAVSIGRALGYLSTQDRAPDLSETVQLTSINILKRLPDDLRDDCESGRCQIGRRQSELQQLCEVSPGDFHLAHQSQHDELQSQIDALRDEMRAARREDARKHLSHLDTIGAVLKDALNVGAEIENLQPAVKQLMDQAARLSKPQPNVAVKVMPDHYHVQAGADGRLQIVRTNNTMTVLLSETAAQRAERISELSRIRDDRRKIGDELSRLREQQSDLVSRRRDAERDRQLDRETSRRQRVARLQEQRELEQKLQELNKALSRTMAVRDGVETIAAYVPWNVEVEGEAMWQALTGRSVVRARE